jgi:hypothetical protein
MPIYRTLEVAEMAKLLFIYFMQIGVLIAPKPNPNGINSKPPIIIKILMDTQ